MFTSKELKFSPLKEELSVSSNESLDQSVDLSTIKQQLSSSNSILTGKTLEPNLNQNNIIINSSNNNKLILTPNTLNLTNSGKQFQEPLTNFNDNSSTTGLTFSVIIGAFVAFFTNSFASGYNMGVLNTPEQILKAFFNQCLNSNNEVKLINDNQIEILWSIAVSLLVVGALVTSILTGTLANFLGRRGVICLNIIVGLLAMFITWSSKYLSNVPMFLAGRLVAGFHTGIASSIVPMYLMEISPKSSASFLGTIHVMGLNGGIFLAQLLGLESILGTPKLWQLLFFVNAALISVGIICICFIPESPVYLFMVKKSDSETISVLQKLRKTSQEVNEDFLALKREQKCGTGNERSFFQLLKQSKFRNGLLIICVLHAGQQLIGINAIFYYSTNTFRSVGLSQLQSQYGSIGCSLLNTLCAILASRLFKSFSTRTMILISAIGTTCSLAILPISMTFNTTFPWLNYVTIFTMYFYVFIFAIGLGPIPFMIGSQLFDSSSMAIGVSCGCFVNWFGNFLVAFTFPLLVIYINQLVFLIFFLINLALLIFIVFQVPAPTNPTNEVK